MTMELSVIDGGMKITDDAKKLYRELDKIGRKLTKILLKTTRYCDILKNTSEISEMCHRTEEPIYITKNGYGDMVIMSMENYESTMKQLAMYRDIEISERQIETGQVKDARKALGEMRAKYGL